MSNPGERENFLARWAQRKAEIAKAETPAQEPSADAAACEPPAQAEPFDLSSLPSLEDLTAETDIRPFMNALVPESLRNAALRRVWELDTAIRDYVSPATEYAWNWNEGGDAPGYGPLEVGYKAVEAAEKMFSKRIEDHTLVETPPTPGESDGLPLLNKTSDRDLRVQGLSSEAQPSGGPAQIRLSAKTELDSSVNEQSDASSPNPAIEAPDVPANKPPAPFKQSAARHGGATPR